MVQRFSARPISVSVHSNTWFFRDYVSSPCSPLMLLHLLWLGWVTTGGGRKNFATSNCGLHWTAWWPGRHLCSLRRAGDEVPESVVGSRPRIQAALYIQRGVHSCCRACMAAAAETCISDPRQCVSFCLCDWSDGICKQ